MIELLTLLWLFNASVDSAKSTLTAQDTRAVFMAPADLKSSFTVKFTVDLKKFDGEKIILEVPNVLSVRLRRHDPLNRNRQNYPAFKMPDGSVPVLEASIVLNSIEHPDWKKMTIGIPLALLKHPQGQHEVVLNFSGVHWTMYVDGKLLDNDFPFGYPQWRDRNRWEIDPKYVKQAAIYIPAIKPERRQVEPPDTSLNIQYWSPPGHNSWVGDVVTFFHQGRYHVFYLFDRRHHSSKFGCGAHYFEHISTSDFKTWIEHEAATPLQEQWECIGTGTPFVFNNQFYLSYGLHTTRVYPVEKTMLPTQWEYLNTHGHTGEFKIATTPGTPAGSTYAVSADGISHFKKTNIMFHPCENPSIYTAPSGKLQMLANFRSNGIWESESVNGGWHCINPGFPPGGDCTFFFQWGKFDYIIGGFTKMWSKPAEAPNSAYKDVVHQGLDFYDGLNVPAVTEIADGRFLMAGWIRINGWGGNLVIRELIQFPNGRISSKWMQEITPATETPHTLAARIAEMKTCPISGKSFMLSLNVEPTECKKGKLGISFLPEDGTKAACEFQIDLDCQRAQFGPGALNVFADRQKSLRQGGAPQRARNYAVENLMDIDRPFTVRVLVKGCDKIGGSLVDAEIAGCRTMISYRPDLIVKKIVFRPEGVELSNVQVAAIKN